MGETLRMGTFWDLPGLGSSSQWIYYWNMVLKWPFIGDTGEDMVLHIHCSGHQGERTSSHYDRFTWKMVLKRPFDSDTGEASAYSLFRYSQEIELWAGMVALLRDGLENLIHQWHCIRNCVHLLFRTLGERVSSCYDSFTQRIVLKRLFFGDTREDSAQTFIVHVPWETEPQVEMIDLLKRQSSKGHLSVTLGKTVQVFKETALFESIK